VKETPKLEAKRLTKNPTPPISLNQTQPMPKTVQSTMSHKQITVTLTSIMNHLGNRL